MRTRSIQRWLAWTVFAIFVGSVLTWHYTRETLPREIRIATAAHGGLYHKFAEALRPLLIQRTSRQVTLIETEGSRENRQMLIEGHADLAIIQSGAVSMDGIGALAPLYRDVVIVVARRGAGINDVCDLAGQAVSIGTEGSGMRASALQLLRHYHIDVKGLHQTERYFLDMMTDDEIDAAIITTGLINPDLEKLLDSGRFELMPVLDAKAFCVRHPSFEVFEIPRGLYAEGPPIPAEPRTTVATTAFLAASSDVSSLLVSETLSTLYENDLRSTVPILLDPSEAIQWRQRPLHPIARRYLDPYGGIEVIASFMESLAATKELLFALGAGLYLIWLRWRGMRIRERERDLGVMKERLDDLLDETSRIERAQMATVDGDKLKQYLDDVTRIKLRAIDELTHEDLRSDQMFAIFLMQCGNLISKIQAKIAMNMK